MLFCSFDLLNHNENRLHIVVVRVTKGGCQSQIPQAEYNYTLYNYILYVILYNYITRLCRISNSNCPTIGSESISVGSWRLLWNHFAIHLGLLSQ